ncbi:glycosyltransferase [Boseongicola sp. H5]|uniref:glycosyltransferase n=1 Tax=Boseongicola sp. H5 TaxID=2763261 RepID=UPI001D0A9566|nr:glycosyltransferase [Boseongicola sp. H5]
MSKKILHMHFGKDGGAERFFVNLVQGFGERGAEQRFVTRPDRIWKQEIAPLGPIIESHYRRISPGSALLTWRVHRMIRDWRPDVIMAWMSRSSRLIPNYPGAVKLTRLGDYPRHLRHFRHNDLIVGNTPGIAQACRDLGWRKPALVVSNFAREVTPVPVDRASVNTPDDAFVICGSGRFVHRKGFDVLIRAAAQIPDVWLWLVGEGERRAELEALVSEVGLAERARFLGWVDEPMHHVAACDVFVMPSRHEPLGNVILESWKAQVPTISTRCEGPSWFATDGQDCLLVEIDDVAGMKAAISRVKEEPGLAAHLVAAGTATLEAKFTKDRVLDQYFEIFGGRY